MLLTGANGFIGSQISAALLKEGMTLRAAVRQPAKFKQRFPSAEAVRLDFNEVLNDFELDRILAGVDAIVNCAGVLQSGRGQHARSIHQTGPIRLFEAAVRRGIRRIVQISAVSIDADTEYAHTKMAADVALQALPCNWTILRPSIVYGRQAYGGTALLRALAVCPGGMPVIGDGQQMSTPIHLSDLCKTVLLTLMGNRLDRKIVYPCGPQALSIAEILPLYREWLGLEKVPLVHLPKGLVGFAAWLGDWVGSGALTTTSLKQLEHGNACDPAEFKKATGLAPISFGQALQLEPAGTAELWQARLTLAKPLVRTALIILWSASGLAGFLASGLFIQKQFSVLPIGADAALALGRGASLIDLVIALLLLVNRWPKLAFSIQMIMIVGYSTALTLLRPELWLELYGPIIKNIPILALVIVLRILDEER